MKKSIQIIICTVSFIILFFLCYDYKTSEHPNEYYNVYLEGEFLGSIISKEDLENYINDKTEHLINIKTITKTYCDANNLDEIKNSAEVKSLIDKSPKVDEYEKNGEKCIDIEVKDGKTIEKIYTPNGLEIVKNVGYTSELASSSDIYDKIVSKKSFTVKGLEFTFTNPETDKLIQVYTLDKTTFEDAIKLFIENYVGHDAYNDYLQGKQTDSTSKENISLIENVYINESITYKEKQIPVNEVIYTTPSDLAQYLLYGNNPVSKTYTVKADEMISDIAYVNEISTQEFVMSNPKYKDSNALIKEGTVVSIKQTNPQIKLVVEMYTEETKNSEFKTIYQYDDNAYIGDDKIIQEGSEGKERIKQRLKIENGRTVYVEPKGKTIIEASVDRIILKGEKAIPNVGSLTDWAWPSESGWTSTDGYEWRIHPITGERAFHYGIDIAGTGYNSAIYASNNGTIITKVAMHWSFGNYIVIDHNNGYYTLYAHMNKFMPNLNVGDTVARGQQIGYVGSTGQSTGPHIHFEVWQNCEYCRINPWSIFRKGVR